MVLLLTLPAPYILESSSKIKSNLNFYFYTSCGVSKGFMKAFIKPFEVPQKKSENKNLG